MKQKITQCKTILYLGLTTILVSLGRLGFENKQHTILAPCETEDTVSGSELFITHKVTEKENRFAVYY